MPPADAGEEHAEIVVDLGDCAHGRSGDCVRRSSAGSRSMARARRSDRLRAWASVPGTGGHSLTNFRRNAFALQHKGCQKRASSCPSPRLRSGEIKTPRGSVQRDVAQVIHASSLDHGCPILAIPRKSPPDSVPTVRRGRRRIVYTCQGGLSIKFFVARGASRPSRWGSQELVDELFKAFEIGDCLQSWPGIVWSGGPKLRWPIRKMVSTALE